MDEGQWRLMANPGVIQYPSSKLRWQAVVKRWTAAQRVHKAIERCLWCGKMVEFSDEELWLLKVNGWLSESDCGLLKRAGRLPDDKIEA